MGGIKNSPSSSCGLAGRVEDHLVALCSGNGDHKDCFPPILGSFLAPSNFDGADSPPSRAHVWPVLQRDLPISVILRLVCWQSRSQSLLSSNLGKFPCSVELRRSRVSSLKSPHLACLKRSTILLPPFGRAPRHGPRRRAPDRSRRRSAGAQV